MTPKLTGERTGFSSWNIRMNTSFRALPTVPQSAAGDRVYMHRQGKALGGSSAINGAVYLRPDVREFQVYEALGAKGWSWESFLEYFKRSETLVTEGDTFGLEPDLASHGTEGPIQVSFGHGVSSFFREYAMPTFKNLGQEVNADVSDGTPIGGAPMQLTLFDGTFNRSYAANSYYLPNRERENLVVLTESLVSKITWGEDQDGLAVANGVEYTSANGTSTANGKNIIVSSGALNTPKVLELSGIGDPLVLSGIGIELKVNNTGVGKNLQNQYGINVRYKLKDGAAEIGDEFQAPLMNLVPAQIVLSPEDLARSAEILTEPTNDISQAQFDGLKKLIDDGVAQTEIMWGVVAGENGSVELQLYITDLHTFSRGTSHASSSNPEDKVIVDPQYFSAEHDWWYLAKAVMYSRNITAAEPLKSIIDYEVLPGANYTTTESIQQWLLPNFRTMSHFVGTASALPQEAGGVVDPETLIVYGTSNVRVVDCSVVPLIPGIHTQSIAYAIAEKAADILKNAA
ncbi:glucose oxidase [Moniliophthora roreri MCA 2997]|uniref:Glucose oxidase n=1 Tax=Moniliophthora roreri (strain MCA 2997) TaxID=1381753 RepID=V2XP29_MONRO|nr:glucose oxidase [Moniliophthora roreri MCA 2997]